MNKSSPLRLKIKEAIESQQQLLNEQAKINTQLLTTHCSRMEKEKNKQHTERRLYARLIYRFIYFWCATVAFLLIGCGIGKFRLSDIVLITIIVSTSLHIFGFFYLIRLYIQSKNKPM